MKAIEAHLRDAQEKVYKASESINTLPLDKQTTTILSQRKFFVEVERIQYQ